MDVLNFGSYEEAIFALETHEKENNEKFVLLFRKNRTQVSELNSLDGYVVKFEDLRGDIPIQYDGTPFIHLGTEVRECHQGPQRKKSQMNSKETTDLDFRKERKMIQPSKKVGCTAQVKFRIILKFPSFKVDGKLTPKIREKVVAQLRSSNFKDMLKEEVVFMRFCNEHHDHVTGEDAAFLQPIHQSVKDEIKLLVEEGVRSAEEVLRLVKVKNRMSGINDKTRRYNPTMHDIRNHIYMALNKGYNNDDQTRLLHAVQKWKEAKPEDKFLFKPASIDEEGNITTILFVHQTKFQQKILSKYGNEMVLMDSTHKTVKYNVPMFFMCVLTNMGYMLVATFIVGHNNSKEISDALQII